jgi:hypothetical protein
MHAADQRRQLLLGGVENLPVPTHALRSLLRVARAPEEPPDVLVLLRRERDRVGRVANVRTFPGKILDREVL